MSLSQLNYGPAPLRAVKSSRRSVVLRPVTEGATYGGGSVIRLPLSGVDFCDPLSLMISWRFDVASNGRGADAGGGRSRGGLCLPQSMESLVDFVTIRVSSRTVEDIREWAVGESIYSAIQQSTDSVRSIGAIVTGQTLTDAERLILYTAGAQGLTAHALRDRYYAIPLALSGLFGSNSSLVPIRWLAARQSVELEIRLKPAGEAFTVFAGTVTGAGTDYVPPTSTTYTLAEVQCQFDALDADSAALAWDRIILERALVYPIKAVTNYTTQLPQSSTNFNYQFSHPSEDLRTILVAFTSNGLQARSQAAGTPTCWSDFLYTPRFLAEASLQVGTRLFPETQRLRAIWKQAATGTDPNSVADMYLAAIMAFGRANDWRTGYNLTERTYALNKSSFVTTGVDDASTIADYRSTFFLAFNLSSAPHEGTPDEAGVGVSTLSATTHNLTLNMLFSAARGAYDAAANPYGGDFTIHVFAVAAANIMIFSDRVELESKLVIPSAEEE